MADIPVIDQEEMELKILELQYRLRDQENALMKIDIDEKRMALRFKGFDKSRESVKESILKTQEEIASLQKRSQEMFEDKK